MKITKVLLIFILALLYLAGPAFAEVTYTGKDTATKGNWRSPTVVYGADGYVCPAMDAPLPSDPSWYEGNAYQWVDHPDYDLIDLPWYITRYEGSNMPCRIRRADMGIDVSTFTQDPRDPADDSKRAFTAACAIGGDGWMAPVVASFTVSPPVDFTVSIYSDPHEFTGNSWLITHYVDDSTGQKNSPGLFMTKPDGQWTSFDVTPPDPNASEMTVTVRALVQFTSGGEESYEFAGFNVIAFDNGPVFVPPVDCGEVWDRKFGIAEDFDKDCEVGASDLAVIVQDWLKCNDPQQQGCIENW